MGRSNSGSDEMALRQKMFQLYDTIEFFQDAENLQMCHIQIASKDPEIFEYAIE